MLCKTRAAVFVCIKGQNALLLSCEGRYICVEVGTVIIIQGIQVSVARFRGSRRRVELYIYTILIAKISIQWKEEEGRGKRG